MARSGTAQEQGELWGARAFDWADVQEKTMRPLYDAVLELLDLGPDTMLLDVGCGAGLFASLAAARGAEVHGIDAAPGMLAVARGRVPNGTFQPGEIEELPYGERTFDVVTALNSLQFANDPANAMREAARVAREHAPVVVAAWGEPQDSDASAYRAAIVPLMPPSAPGGPGPLALSDPGALEGLVSQAALDLRVIEDVVCVWEYEDLDTALRGLLSAGPAALAIRHSGEPAVREAATRALEAFKTARGGYRLENVFRYAVATA